MTHSWDTLVVAVFCCPSVSGVGANSYSRVHHVCATCSVSVFCFCSVFYSFACVLSICACVLYCKLQSTELSGPRHNKHVGGAIAFLQQRFAMRNPESFFFFFCVWKSSSVFSPTDLPPNPRQRLTMGRAAWRLSEAACLLHCRCSRLQ